MTFILYNREDCPFCWKVRLVAEFVGVEFDFINVERGEQNEDVISLNPGGTVPVMITESFVLWDSSLIAIYLADAHKEAGLLPEDAANRVQILQTCLYSDVYFGKAIFPYVKEDQAACKACSLAPEPSSPISSPVFLSRAIQLGERGLGILVCDQSTPLEVATNNRSSTINADELVTL